MADDTKTPTEVTEEKPAVPAEPPTAEKSEEPTTQISKQDPPTVDTPVPAEATLETTTANDGNISINKSDEEEIKPAVAEAVKPEEPVGPVAPTSNEPVVVKAEDVQAQAPETERLQEQIESLTGEIQALEAKIERLTSGSTSTPTEQPLPTPAVEKPVESEIEKPTELVKPEEKPQPKTEPAAFSPAPIPSTPTPASPVADIYSSIGKPRPPMDPAVQNETAHPSAIAVISEVLVILGTILFVILAATPLFREMVGEDLYQVIRSVGWLTTAATLLLGTLMAVFGKAKSAITLIGFVFLLLSAFMYVGMNYPSLLGPLESSLSSVFNFYR